MTTDPTLAPEYAERIARAQKATTKRDRANYERWKAEAAARPAPPQLEWTTVEGVECYRIGEDRHVAVPANSYGRRARQFHVIDVEAGKLVCQLRRDEVYRWLVRAHRTAAEASR